MLEQAAADRYLLKQALAHSAEEEGCTQASDPGLRDTSYRYWSAELQLLDVSKINNRKAQHIHTVHSFV
jgi:hypothetical protein